MYVSSLSLETGSAANYIIPAVLNLSLLRRSSRPGSPEKEVLISEATLNKAIIVFGVAFMVIGTANVVQEAGSHGA